MHIQINDGEQFGSGFVAVNPNSKIPALVARRGDTPLAIFESGAIMMYLAEKHGRFWPQDTTAKYDVAQWLMFQMASVGPMFGQANHFNNTVHLSGGSTVLRNDSPLRLGTLAVAGRSVAGVGAATEVRASAASCLGAAGISARRI